jgi:hypothetical protein
MTLLAKYYKRPRDPKRTSEAGYINNADNFYWDESINFVIKPSKKDILENNVVLDIFNQQVLKCSVSDMVGTDYDSVFAYFYKNYQNYFDRMFDALGIKAVDEAGESITPTEQSQTTIVMDQPQSEHPQQIEAEPNITVVN